jgi:pilus assembly protein CpaE
LARISPGDTLRVLLVAESEGLREQIGAILAQYAGEHRLFWIVQPELAARRAEDLLPHLVLVDDDLSNMPAPTIVRQLTASVPNAISMVMVDERGMAVARQAVLSGARGFITKPLMAEEFWITVHQLLTQNQIPDQEVTRTTRIGKVVVFVGPKGGTGRTMMATNTSIAIMEQTGQSVVMVDADYAAPALDVVLNLEGARDINTLLARASRLDKDLVSSVLANHTSGLRVLLAPAPIYGTLEISLPQVEQIVSQLRMMFDWVVIDLGALLDESGYAFLDSADYIVMTVVPELVCLRNTRLLLDQLEARGYPADRVWVVLNRAGINGGVAKNDIEERLHVRVRHSIPDDQPLVSLSVNRGVPLYLSHRRSAVARAVEEFAVMFVTGTTKQPVVVETPKETPAPASNPFSRMFRRINSTSTAR